MFGDYEDQLQKYVQRNSNSLYEQLHANRKNFTSLTVMTVHKFCQLLELDHLLEFFPLLKGREKLKQQDQIWQKICHDLKWQYIFSI